MIVEFSERLLVHPSLLDRTMYERRVSEEGLRGLLPLNLLAFVEVE